MKRMEKQKRNRKKRVGKRYRHQERDRRNAKVRGKRTDYIKISNTF